MVIDKNIGEFYAGLVIEAQARKERQEAREAKEREEAKQPPRVEPTDKFRDGAYSDVSHGEIEHRLPFKIITSSLNVAYKDENGVSVGTVNRSEGVVKDGLYENNATLKCDPFSRIEIVSGWHYLNHDEVKKTKARDEIFTTDELVFLASLHIMAHYRELRDDGDKEMAGMLEDVMDKLGVAQRAMAKYNRKLTDNRFGAEALRRAEEKRARDEDKNEGAGIGKVKITKDQEWEHEVLSVCKDIWKMLDGAAPVRSVWDLKLKKLNSAMEKRPLECEIPVDDIGRIYKAIWNIENGYLAESEHVLSYVLNHYELEG